MKLTLLALLSIAGLALASCGGAAPLPDTMPDTPEAPGAPEAPDAPETPEEPLDDGGRETAPEPNGSGGGTTTTVHDRGEVEALAATIASASDDLSRRVADTEPDTLRTCAEICDASGGICGSSKKICHIADRHPADGFFAERCQWATDICRGATERCATCAD